MRLLILAFSLCALFLSVSSFPLDDEPIAELSKPLRDKFQKGICGQGIKPGGQADVDWVKDNILSYYLSKEWLTKDPPKGWNGEIDKIIKKCHKDTYNYCDQGDRDKVKDCVKGMAGSLMYCPILDKTVGNWETSGDKEQAFQLMSDYCKTKGKTC
ncbi:hypothetical protein M413DRAFT_11542 [Hebeloma cylindrosporum]|uniref:Uncharacterized protein n=1 Tax=Hebeloma cylindrosporum TaxID=76867 RepID=A0A0C3CAU5_HEBCY|nr:hypothetical protein M413DRAFT_11542 [Hebeloma cylindrosporum h7]